MPTGYDYCAQGRMLWDWQKEFDNQYSIPQLLKIVLEGGDLQKMLLMEKGLLSD